MATNKVTSQGDILYIFSEFCEAEPPRTNAVDSTEVVSTEGKGSSTSTEVFQFEVRVLLFWSV